MSKLTILGMLLGFNGWGKRRSKQISRRITNVSKKREIYSDWREVSMGYSRDMRPNPAWKKLKLVCKYEHCVENMPLGDGDHPERECPVFGHKCPGGKAAVANCEPNLNAVTLP